MHEQTNRQAQTGYQTGADIPFGLFVVDQTLRLAAE